MSVAPNEVIQKQVKVVENIKATQRLFTGGSTNGDELEAGKTLHSVNKESSGDTKETRNSENQGTWKFTKFVIFTSNV